MSESEYARMTTLQPHPLFNAHYHHFSEGLFMDSATLLSPGDVAIDAGCFEGANALAFARAVGPSGTVLTFEPDPRLHERMAAKLRTNEGGLSCIELHQTALGDTNGETTFFVLNELEGHSGLGPKAEGFYNRPVTYTKVDAQVRTLDTILTDFDISHDRVKAIKFDLEGAELKAFRGATSAIDQGQPIIMFEYGCFDVFGFTPDDYFEFFAQRNYRLVSCFDTDIPTLANLKEQIGWNIFALPISNPYVRGDLSRLISKKMPSFMVDSA